MSIYSADFITLKRRSSMLVKILCIAILSVIIFLPLRDAKAVETLSLAELALHCEVYLEDSEGEDAIFCVRYIQGFIDGAVVTDERVTRNVAAEYEQQETFAKRAMRTRGVSRHLEKFATYYAEFCLGAPVPLKEVVEKVVADIISVEADSVQQDARAAVYQVLRNEYPCEKYDGE